MSQWSILQRKAKDIETKLQLHIDQYSSIIQKLNEEFIPQYDEEHGPLLNHTNSNLDTKHEYLIKEIEEELYLLLEYINKMKDYNNNNNNNNSHSNLNGISSGSNIRMNEELIKRYNEIYFDFNNEFKSLTSTMNRKRDSMELFNTTKPYNNTHHSNNNNNTSNNNNSDHGYDTLQKESNIISQSMFTVNNVLGQAFEARNMLTSQRNTLLGANTSASGVTNTGASINRLLDGISKKKANENIVIVIFISILLCFTIWWIFLR